LPHLSGKTGVARFSLLNGTTVNPEQMTLHGHQAGCEGRAQAVTADCLLPGKIANLGLENRILLRCTVSKMLLEICYGCASDLAKFARQSRCLPFVGGNANRIASCCWVFLPMVWTRTVCCTALLLLVAVEARAADSPRPASGNDQRRRIYFLESLSPT